MTADYVRGGRAYQIIRGANLFNPEPEEGYKYLLVKVKLRYISGKASQPVSAYNFKAYSDGAGYSPTLVISQSLFPNSKPLT